MFGKSDDKKLLKGGPVTSIGQSGGVTASIYVNQAPEPTIDISQPEAWERVPAGFAQVYPARVRNGGSASTVTIFVEGPGALAVGWGADGSMQEGGGGRKGNRAFKVLKNPNALREIIVIAEAPEGEFAITWTFD